MKRIWKWLSRRSKTPSLSGDIAIAIFVFTQCLEGILTYVGVTNWGFDLEANPLIRLFMSEMGIGIGLIVVKLMGIGFGIFLYWRGLHNCVAALAVFYLVFIVLPWIAGISWLLQ